MRAWVTRDKDSESRWLFLVQPSWSETFGEFVGDGLLMSPGGATSIQPAPGECVEIWLSAEVRR